MVTIWCYEKHVTCHDSCYVLINIIYTLYDWSLIIDTIKKSSFFDFNIKALNDFPKEFDYLGKLVKIYLYFYVPIVIIVTKFKIYKIGPIDNNHQKNCLFN
jgi:hypothetical protein